MRLNVVIVEDHKLFAEGLSALLKASDKWQVQIVHMSDGTDDLVKFLLKKRVHVIILDLNLGVANGLDLIVPLKEAQSKAKVLILTGYSNMKYVKTAFVNGADGYILKSADLEELERGIESVMADNTFMGNGVQVTANRSAAVDDRKKRSSMGPYMDAFLMKQRLTNRELEILELITQAFSNKQIALKLYISDQTVSVHRKNIMRKLGVSNTVSLVKAAQQLSLS
ncbi:MAG: response regulator transcription factor [Saprospiraceae bacterium]|nr:response regulator transcription factor [Saprospiraceae bacterium]